MKSIIAFVLATIAIPAFAICPSVDAVISEAKVGMVTIIEVQDAIVCNLDAAMGPKAFCDLRLAILAEKVSSTVEMYNVGEVTVDEVTKSALELSKARKACGR